MKKLIIIGGGFAGSYCARKLESHFDTVLIDSKDYFEFTPSVLRTLVEPSHGKAIELQHVSYLKKARYVQGIVSKLEKGSGEQLVVDVSGTKIACDYVIIATGSHYATPIKNERMVLANRSRELTQYSSHLSSAESVIIIGGGVVGVELAAEIACGYPDKKVILIHSGMQLCDRLPLRAREYITAFLLKKNVEIVFNERVKESSGKVFSTVSGRHFTCDLAFWCTGIKASNECLVNSPAFSSCVLLSGGIEVESTLQLKGQVRCFVAGDVSAIVEEKLAQSAEAQAKVVVHNILALEKGEELNLYTPQSRTMIISLGERDGVICSGSHVLCGLVAGLMKRSVEWVEMRKLRGWF